MQCLIGHGDLMTHHHPIIGSDYVIIFALLAHHVVACFGVGVHIRIGTGLPLAAAAAAAAAAACFCDAVL